MTNPYVQSFKELQAELGQSLQKTAATKARISSPSPNGRSRSTTSAKTPASQPEPMEKAEEVTETKSKKTKPKNDPCWKGYKAVGRKKKGKKTVPNCVPMGKSARYSLMGIVYQLVGDQLCLVKG